MSRKRVTDGTPMVHVRDLVSDYESGMSCRAVGEKHGISHDCVRRWLIKAGVARRQRGGRPTKVIGLDEYLAERDGGDQ